MARRVALLNNKGGVGKTTFTCLIAEAAARRGARVLVVDMDPQANATVLLGVAPEPDATLAEALRHTRTLGSAAGIVHACQWRTEFAQRIDVLPAELALEDRVLEAGQNGAANRLRKALYGVDDAYDLTLIDCPPSMGHLTTLAVAALDQTADDDGDGDTVLVPLTADRFAISGAKRAIAFLDMWRVDLGVPDLTVSGLLVNAVRTGTSLHEDRSAEIREEFTVPVWGDPLPLRARLAETLDDTRPISSDRDLAPILEIFDGHAERLLGRERVAA